MSTLNVTSPRSGSVIEPSNPFALPLLSVVYIINTTIGILLPNSYSPTSSALLFFIALYSIYIRNTIRFLVASPIIFLHSTVVVSLVFIEGGAFMDEMGRYGFTSGATSTYSLLAVVFTIVCVQSRDKSQGIALATLPKDINNNIFFTQWAAFTFCIAAVAWLLLKGGTTGFPLLQGYDRFAYRREMGDPITGNLLNMKIVIASFLGASAALCSAIDAKYRHHGAFIAYTTTSFLFGDKFFIIIVAFLFYILPQIVLNDSNVRIRLRRIFPYVVLVFFSAAFVTLYIYSGSGTLSWERTTERLINRFANQGQLWFVATSLTPSLIDLKMELLSLNIKSIFSDNAHNFVFDNRLGAFYFIEHYAPANIYNSFKNNVGFVAPILGLFPYFVEIFGLIGTLVAVICLGFVFRFICSFFIVATRRNNPFEVLLPAHMYLLFYYFFVNGHVHLLFGLGAMKAFLAIFFLQLIVRFWMQKVRNH